MGNEIDETDGFNIAISVDKTGSRYKASGNMTSGFVKLMIGELEVVKSRLIYDLEQSLDEGYKHEPR